MFNSLERLKQGVLGRQNNPERLLVNQMAMIMMEMNVSYSDLMEMPIPAFVELGKALRDIKKIEKQMMTRGKK